MDEEINHPALGARQKDVSGGWKRVEQRIGSILPCQRSLHAAACWKDNMIVFGGYDGHQRLNDLHCFNFTSSKWSLMNGINAPSPRDRHSAVVFKNKFVVFGGFDGITRVNDFHFFDMEALRWNAINTFVGTPPSARHSHSCVRWRNSIYIFGGYDESYRNDLMEYHFPTWTWSTVRD